MHLRSLYRSLWSTYRIWHSTRRPAGAGRRRRRVLRSPRLTAARLPDDWGLSLSVGPLRRIRGSGGSGFPRLTTRLRGSIRVPRVLLGHERGSDTRTSKTAGLEKWFRALLIRRPGAREQRSPWVHRRDTHVGLTGRVRSPSAHTLSVNGEARRHATWRARACRDPNSSRLDTESDGRHFGLVAAHGPP